MTRRVGIVANEFFDARIGRVGGFGWVARRAAETLRAARGELEGLYLSGDLWAWDDTARWDSFGIELLLNDPDEAAYRARLRARAVSLVLTIDYRPGYDYPLRNSAPAEVVVWVQDPRPPEDVEKVATLRVPGQPSARPQGIEPVDCTGLASAVEAAQAAGRRVAFASPAPGLVGKVLGTYGVRPEVLHLLPYSLDVPPPADGARSPHPRVVFLGRLDPIKRPWLFVELARAFPAVEFLVCGRSHFSGPGAWEPRGLPENVTMCGHLVGEAKRRVLQSSWALVNTSIHEALPVSFVEALAHELPVLSCQDPEGVCTRFGVFVGRHDGTGLDALPALREGLALLLEDGDRRRRLGQAGRTWAISTHGEAHFLRGLRALEGAS